MGATMAKVEQHDYLSDEAMALRRRDGCLPHQVHPCECDSFDGWKPGEWPELDRARELRKQIEADDGQP